MTVDQLELFPDIELVPTPASAESHAIRLFQPPGNTAGADDD